MESMRSEQSLLILGTAQLVGVSVTPVLTGGQEGSLDPPPQAQKGKIFAAQEDPASALPSGGTCEGRGRPPPSGWHRGGQLWGCRLPAWLQDCEHH